MQLRVVSISMNQRQVFLDNLKQTRCIEIKENGPYTTSLRNATINIKDPRGLLLFPLRQVRSKPLKGHRRIHQNRIARFLELSYHKNNQVVYDLRRYERNLSNCV